MANSSETVAENLALGGSTTECAVVPQDRRWPDLLHTPTANYGISGNSSIDSYYNLKYLLENKIAVPKKVLLMNAINDLRSWLKRDSLSFDLQSWSPTEASPLSLDNPGVRILPFLQIKQSALLSFLLFYYKELSGRKVYQNYLHQVKQQEKIDPMNESDFLLFLNIVRSELLSKRGEVYHAFSQLAKIYRLKIYLITQPHSYRNDYQPFKYDLRLYPVYRNKKLNISQTATIMKLINDNTREIADEFNFKLIDVSKYFQELDPDSLLYDSVHFTPVGCQKMAAVINQTTF